MTGELLLLTAIIVYIVDLSGFTDSWKGWLKKALHARDLKSMKPFDCSLCMAWWCGLLYIIMTGRFTLAGVAMVAGSSFLAYPIGAALQAVRDLLLCLIGLIQKLIYNATNN